MAMARPSSRMVVRKGWDAAQNTGNPVPGDVPKAMEELGLSVTKVVDDEAYALCPAHLERMGKVDHHPSFSVNVDEGVFSCFSCGFKGTFVSLARHMLGGDRHEAVSWVRQRGGVEHARRRLDTSGGLQVVERPHQEVNEASLALYVSPPAEALARRRLSATSAKRHGVLWDKDKGCWIIPIRDAYSGRLMGWQEKHERYFRNQPYSVKKARTLFGLQQFVGTTAILVESPLDVLRFDMAGIDGALSSFGDHVSAEQMMLVRECSDVLILAQDNDRAGRLAVKSLVSLYARKMNIKVFNYSDFDIKDPGDATDDQLRYGIRTALSSTILQV